MFLFILMYSWIGNVMEIEDSPCLLFGLSDTDLLSKEKNKFKP
jgi:hypothetical protein